MASVQKDIILDADPGQVWSAVRDFGSVDRVLATGFVVESRLDGRDRVVTFASGAVATETLIALDDDRRRLVYSIVVSRLGFEHHSSSLQVIEEGDGRTRLIWIADILPDTLAPTIDALMDQGADAIRKTLQS